jgi:hypothetical protein
VSRYEAPQLAFLLHRPQRAGVALQPVGHDLARVAGVLAGKRPAEEALGGLLVPRGAEQEIDTLQDAGDDGQLGDLMPLGARAEERPRSPA